MIEEMGVSKACQLCQSDGVRTMGANPDFPESAVVRCEACGYMWTDPAPSAASLDDFYSGRYREIRRETATAKYLANADRRARSQKSFITAHATTPLQDARVLDIGCSAGSLLKCLGESTGNLAGYEPDAGMLAAARTRLPAGSELVCGAYAPGMAKTASADLVTLSHVLEHIADPVEFLRELLRIARPGGSLFIEVPHETDKSVGEIIRAGYASLGHLVFFSPRSLRSAIERAGGRVAYVSTWGPDRDSFSVVPRKRSLAARVGARLAAMGAREDSTCATACETDMTDRETPESGIWIRAIAEKI